MRRIGAVILAAGASTRLGEPKQLVRLGDENLLERSVRVAREAGCEPIVVVLGASADLVREQSRLTGTEIVTNEGWAEGMASSIRAGVAALGQVAGAVLMTCDMPAVTAEHIVALIRDGGVAGTSHSGQQGVPAHVPRALFPSLMKLQGDEGARDLLRGTISIELRGSGLDVDTAADRDEAQSSY